jgi:hypothetical protein
MNIPIYLTSDLPMVSHTSFGDYLIDSCIDGCIAVVLVVVIDAR